MAAVDRLPSGPNTKSTQPEALPALLRIGHLMGAHGLGGAMRLKPDDPTSITLEQVHRVFICHGDTTREYTLREVRRLGRNTVRLVLDGVNDTTAAQTLKGATVAVASGDLPPLRPGEFYHFQAIGAEVFTTDGRRLGCVEEVMATGANDVWVVRDGDTEVLVPVITDVVRTMDLEHRRITIEAVPGLLE
ncbi:MAG: ribosome maturation factor RimM [Candidatus Binataceae bacterium]